MTTSIISVPETISIRNPRVRALIGEEMQHGAGRNAAEAAENLINEAAERRRIERATATRLPVTTEKRPIPE